MNGRPPKGEQVRSKKMTFRISDIELQKLQECASKMNITRADALMAGIRLLRKKLIENNQPEMEFGVFYLKYGKKKLFIDSENVFTQCPKCGKEFRMDLADAVIDGELDLYGMSWYCKKCGAEQRALQNVL